MLTVMFMAAPLRVNLYWLAGGLCSIAQRPHHAGAEGPNTAAPERKKK
jgi:hypothetical protein